MPKLLVNLLGIDKLKFNRFIDRLEHVCLRPGVDIRLSTDIIVETRNRIRLLSLDVSDTTTRELFYALKHKLTEDEKNLKAKLGLKRGSKDKNTKKIAEAASRFSGREKSLSMSVAGTKRVLKAVPPKRTLKALKLRSLDSVLKRHDPRILYALASLVENASWHTQVQASIKRLGSKDIQWQSVSCLPVPEKWHERLHSALARKGALFVNEEAGVVCLLPVVDVNRPGAVVLQLGLALNAASIVAASSLPFKSNALFHGFNSILPRIAAGDYPEIGSIHGLVPSWKIAHQLVGQQHIVIEDSDSELEVFDMFWESTETKLAAMVPDMDFWVSSHFLGADGPKGPVSLHVLDVAISLVATSEYGKQPTQYLKSSLWHELQFRYLLEDILSRSLVKQLSEITANVVT